MLKRTRDAFDSPTSSSPLQEHPSKRSHTTGSILEHASPLASRPLRHASSSSSLVSLPFRTPRTPFTDPSDSPNNPVGLQRSLVALELPRSIPYMKHLTLRFQLVTVDPRTGESLKTISFGSGRRERGGIYRIVQVPSNYTFRHLHKLILFLFADDLNRKYPARKSTRTPIPHDPFLDTPLTPSVSSKKGPIHHSVYKKHATQFPQPRGKGNARARSCSPEPRPQHKWGGHVFEVLHRISTYPESMKPGTIRSGGKLSAKLSSVRERRLFRDLYESKDDGVEDTNGEESSEDVDRDDDSSDLEESLRGWTWENVDDFTLSRVWPAGMSVNRGIIYRHRPNVAVHITANTFELDVRFPKGKSNEPYVHMAQGSGDGLIKVSHLILNEKGEEGTFNPPDTCSDFEDELFGACGTELKWNVDHAFHRFLKREGARQKAADLDNKPKSKSCSKDESTLPTATANVKKEDSEAEYSHYHFSSPVEAPPLSSSPAFMTAPSSEYDSEPDLFHIPSSPTAPSRSFSRSSYHHSPNDQDSCLNIWTSTLFPFAQSSITPFPSHPARRKRVLKAEKKLEGFIKGGMRKFIEIEKRRERECREQKEEKKKPKEMAKAKEEDTYRSDKKMRRILALPSGDLEYSPANVQVGGSDEEHDSGVEVESHEAVQQRDEEDADGDDDDEYDEGDYGDGRFLWGPCAYEDEAEL
ncbi:hypothetical protein ABKN59_011930 [Abortiporus biennis]